MKNVLGKITGLMITFLVMGCSGLPSASSSSVNGGGKSSSNNPNSTSQIPSTSSIAPHEHEWSTEWSYDDNNHWHACAGCNQKKDNAAHQLGASHEVDLGTLLNDSKYQYTTVKVRECSTCDYFAVDQKDSVLPEVRITYDANDPHANFATVAKSTDTNRPEVNMSFSLTNCPNNVAVSNKEGTIKVRGNQTAGFPKKGFRIKFDSKINLLGLGGGKRFKKWVLMADAKDTTLSRTALGLTMSKGIIRNDSKVWSSSYTPVSVYLNNTYWGMYWLAEQKEVKDGRIKMPEPEDSNGNPITTTDIGYCFELDHYAESEPKKDDGGDPTFSIKYDGNSRYDIESTLANPGVMTHFTMNSDITDSTAGENKPINASNSKQVAFIAKRLEALYKVLNQAAANNKAYDINSNNEAVATSSLTVRQAMEKHFNLNAWAEGFIINAMACPPDVGYSSFYMSFDNSATGDKKLRFDNPWDFDSNFGNRRLLCEGGDSGQKDPYYMDRTSNMWLQRLSQLDFFINDYVKPLWNQVRNEKVFEKCVDMLKIYYKVYENEQTKNFNKWNTTPNPDDPNVSSYFSGELRDVFKNLNNRKNAQKETINWFSKRVNYFEKKWGENRENLPTV